MANFAKHDGEHIIVSIMPAFLRSPSCLRGRRARLVMLLALVGACYSAAASKAKPVPVDPCPEVPQDAQYDPTDPAFQKRAIAMAPRILLAMGRTRHDRLRAVLASGENPNVCVMGGSILTISAASGDVEEVTILLDGGADPDRPRDSIGGTPLLVALGQGRFDVARLLIARGADVHATTRGNRTPLIELAGALPVADQHISQIELAETLLDAGVPVDASLAVPRTTALMMAAIYGNVELTQFLLRRGADVRLKDSKGQTALDFARKKGHAEVVELLSAAMSSAASAPEPR